MISLEKYRGFTLVELLIVMGILAILMAIGISVGQFALQRANNIQHNDAADQLALAVEAYYTDNREYPADASNVGSADATIETFSSALASTGALATYVDSDAFDGGSDATFYYFSEDDGSPQYYVICVTYGGIDDEAGEGGYCAGNGFTDLGLTKGSMDSDEFATVVMAQEGTAAVEDWEDGTWGGE